MTIEAYSTSLQRAIRGFTLMAWKLNRQRRTLRWRRHEPVGHHWPAVESQQRLAPWTSPIWLPRLNLKDAPLGQSPYS